MAELPKLQALEPTASLAEAITHLNALTEAVNMLGQATIDLARIVDANAERQEATNQRLAAFLQRLATALDGKP